MRGNKILRNICEFPYQLEATRNKSVSPSRRNHLRVTRSNRGNETTPFRFRTAWENSRHNGILPDLKKIKAKKLPKIKLLFSKRVELKDNTFYNIQVQKNRKNWHLYLIAQNESKEVRNDDYYIDLPRKEARICKKIFGIKRYKDIFNNDYESMVESIRIQDDKLVLLNPNYREIQSRNRDDLSEATDKVNNTIG